MEIAEMLGSVSALPNTLTEYGYLVVAHDSGMPGVGDEHMFGAGSLVFSCSWTGMTPNCC